MTLREQLRLANQKITALQHKCRVLEYEIDRERHGFGKVLIRLSEVYPAIDIFRTLDNELGIKPFNDEQKATPCPKS